jgi:hypothetical protein
MKGFDFTVRSMDDLAEAVETFGIVPLFRSSVPGFSVEEHTVPECWYTEGSGEWKVWDWKGPVIRQTGCAYGKFFEKKAVYVSAAWFPDFANMRRGGLSFDECYDYGLVKYGEKLLYDVLAQRAPITSSELKFVCGYGKEAKKGFDPLITRLQMQTYVLICDFVYQRDKYGMPYGWGVAQYTTHEAFFGEDFADDAFARTPEESYARVTEHLRSILPGAAEAQIGKILK